MSPSPEGNCSQKISITEKIRLHRKIVSSFKYNPYLDFLAGIILDDLIEEDNWHKLPMLDEVNIIGPSNPPDYVTGFNIVADSALKYFRGEFNMIVTDLDGPIEGIIEASSEGKFIVVHAHGDNIDKILKIVPKISGNILGTSQSIPVGKIRNIGGFTDGDRSVIMGALIGAKQINIYGFDFDHPVDEPKELKLRKMDFAKEIIGKLRNIRIQYK